MLNMSKLLFLFVLTTATFFGQSDLIIGASPLSPENTRTAFGERSKSLESWAVNLCQLDDTGSVASIPAAAIEVTFLKQGYRPVPLGIAKAEVLRGKRRGFLFWLRPVIRVGSLVVAFVGGNAETKVLGLASSLALNSIIELAGPVQDVPAEKEQRFNELVCQGTISIEPGTCQSCIQFTNRQSGVKPFVVTN